MTAPETVQTIRMLLDDSNDWYFHTSIINAMINKAQLQKINEYIQNGDERPLQPIFIRTWQNNTSIINRRCLHPRACTINGQSALYMPNAEYMNYIARDINISTRFPRELYYTIHDNIINNQYMQIIQYTSSFNLAALWYIREPLPFAYTQTFANDQPLELAPEVHIEVCLLAAELLNNLDVDELERSDIVAPNDIESRMKYQTLGMNK